VFPVARRRNDCKQPEGCLLDALAGCLQAASSLSVSRGVEETASSLKAACSMRLLAAFRLPAVFAA
jgi:hypothetical protein